MLFFGTLDRVAIPLSPSYPGTRLDCDKDNDKLGEREKEREKRAKETEKQEL